MRRLRERPPARLRTAPASPAAAILHVQLEAAHAAETLDGRRRKHADEGLLDAGHLRVEAHRHRVGRVGRILAILERLQCEEHEARVRLRVVVVGRHARELQRAFDAGIRSRPISATCLTIGLGAIDGRARGQLDHRHEVQLVLPGNEAGGHAVQPQRGEPEQADVQHQRDAGAAQGPPTARAGSRGSRFSKPRLNRRKNRPSPRSISARQASPSWRRAASAAARRAPATASAS